MWPSYRDVQAQTDATEWAIERCYHAALWTWIPAITPMILPKLEALPLDPEAPISQQSLAVWEALMHDWVTPARAMIWCYSYLRACHGMKVDPFAQRGFTAAADPEVPYRGISPSGAAANWSSDFPTWLERLKQSLLFKEGEERKAQQRLNEEPGQLENVLNDEDWPWPEFGDDDKPGPTFPDVLEGKYRPGQRNDTVADLVALAWETNPQQMKLAAKLVWNDVSSKGRLQRFLSEPNYKRISNTIPGRVRDMFVGSTTRRARQAIPMSVFKEEMGMWLGNAVNIYGPGKETSEWTPAPPGQQKAATRGDWVVNADREEGDYNGFYKRIWEPEMKVRPMTEFFQRFRDLAQESGFQAAGIINQATITAASQSGIDFDLIWVARIDALTRATHFAADGQRATPGSKFLVGGAELDYPGDPTGPAQLVRNCRCRVGMVNGGDPLPKEMIRTKAQQQEIAFRKVSGIVRAREDPDGIGYIIPMTLTEEDAQKRRAARRARTAAFDEENTMTDLLEAPTTYRTFTDSVVAFLGVPTSDYRLLKTDMDLSFRSFPLPLMWCKQSKEGHSDSYTVGVVESGRVEDGKVLFSGYMLNSPEADEAVELLEHGVTRPSIDMTRVQWALTDEDGNEFTEEQIEELMMSAAQGKVFNTFTAGELMGATLVSTPAFGDTCLSLNDETESRDPALAAAAFPVELAAYPAEFFTDPLLPGPTRPTMNTETGRCYGHLAEFGHLYRGGHGEAVPRNYNDYANFHTSQVMLDNGKQLAVGRLTVKGGHASTAPNVTAATARAHYDNVASAFALVRVGEDAHGIWFSGVPAPGVDPDTFQQGMTSPLSGDWRDCGQGLDLIAAHAVNSPGFPIYSGSSGPDGREVALVAALSPTVTTSALQGMTRDDIKAAIREALTEQRFALERDAALARAERLAPQRSPRELIGERLAKAGL